MTDDEFAAEAAGLLVEVNTRLAAVDERLRQLEVALAGALVELDG
jgi:hypothetical protein